MFALTLLLNTKQRDELYIEKCFSCEEKIYNVIVKHCVSLLNKLKFDKNYQALLEQQATLRQVNRPVVEAQNKQHDSLGVEGAVGRRKVLSKKDKLSKQEEKELKNITKQLNDIRKNIGLTKFDLEKYAKIQQWKYEKYISSQMIQVIVAHVWQGVEDILFDDGQWLHVGSYASYTERLFRF